MAFPSYSGQVVVEGHENLRSFHAQEDVNAGQVVKADTDNSSRSVEPADDTAGEEPLGVAGEDASSGEQVRVALPGAVVRVSPDNSVTSGAFVAASASTNEGEVDTAASSDRIIGRALQDSTGTNTEAGLVMQVAWGQFGD